MLSSGHVFVIHGRIEALTHDAAVIPAGRNLHFRSYWQPVLGSLAQPEPADWRRDGWGRAVVADRVWLVSIGGSRADRFELILDRLSAIVADIVSRGLQPRGGRERPLIAVPPIGLGGTGFGDQRGRVIRELLDRLQALVERHDVDIALVAPDAAVYAAAQYARRKTVPRLPADLDADAQQLGERARADELALFLGAGVSMPAGLPSWTQLLTALAEGSPDLATEDLAPLSAVDQAALIEGSDPEGFQKRVAELARSAERPSVLHALLAALDAGEVVTTNYDVLYEAAVKATGRDVHSVMPWASATGARPWVLKLHGDVDHVDKIVLTRRHMVRYDAANRPSGALLQSLLLTRHLLVVGASLTDDNVVRLAHEVQAYREEHQAVDRHQHFGTVLDVGGDQVRERLWRNQLEWVDLRAAGLGTGPRALELFLDRVAMYASRDSSWLLDQRFEGLLDDPRDRQFAAEARELYARLPRSTGTKWAPLVRRMEELGARIE